MPTKRNRRLPRKTRDRAPALFPRAHQPTVCRLRAGQIVPDKLIVPMKYAESLNISSGDGSLAYSYSQNSVYDPNVTSTGGTVMGFTPLSALYNRYRVLSSKFRVTVQELDGHMTSVSIAPFAVDPGSTTTAEFVSMSRNAKPHMLRYIPVSGSGPSVVLEDEISTTTLLGQSLGSEQNLFGLGSADPVTQFYWVFAATCNDNLAFAVYVTVELEYLVEWTMASDFASGGTYANSTKVWIKPIASADDFHEVARPIYPGSKVDPAVGIRPPLKR